MPGSYASSQPIGSSSPMQSANDRGFVCLKETQSENRFRNRIISTVINKHHRPRQVCMKYNTYTAVLKSYFTGIVGKLQDFTYWLSNERQGSRTSICVLTQVYKDRVTKKTQSSLQTFVTLCSVSFFRLVADAWPVDFRTHRSLLLFVCWITPCNVVGMMIVLLLAVQQMSLWDNKDYLTLPSR